MDFGIRLLGVVPMGDGAARQAMLGPEVRVIATGEVAALVVPAEPPTRAFFLKRDKAALLRSLAAVQRRLEALCQAGPFLACDPGAAICPEPELTPMLDAAQAELAAAMPRFGARHQWDVVLRWNPEAVIAARRDEIAPGPRPAMAAAIGRLLAEEVAARHAALLAALRPHVIAIAEAIPAQGDAETGATIILPAGAEATIEAALGDLPAFATSGATCDLRGPLPALALGALRMMRCDKAELSAAWDRLGLPDTLEPRELALRWRHLAARLHPDTQGPDASAEAMAEAGAAYRLLRQQALGQHGPLRRQAFLSRPGRYLDIPAEAA